MSTLSYKWSADGEKHSLELVLMRGTDGQPFLFGREPNRRPINIREFYISTTPVTQALWLHVVESNPAKWSGIRCPVENVSWNHVTESGGFLDRINASEILTSINEKISKCVFAYPQRRNGNTLRAADRIGKTDLFTAGATTSGKLPGMVRTGAAGMSLSCECSDGRWVGASPIEFICQGGTRARMTLRQRRRINWASTTCPAMSGSGVRTFVRMIGMRCPWTAVLTLGQATSAGYAADATTTGIFIARSTGVTELSRVHMTVALDFRVVLA